VRKPRYESPGPLPETLWTQDSSLIHIQLSYLLFNSRKFGSCRNLVIR
jgi:hypothetical protein